MINLLHLAAVWTSDLAGLAALGAGLIVSRMQPGGVFDEDDDAAFAHTLAVVVSIPLFTLGAALLVVGHLI